MALLWPSTYQAASSFFINDRTDILANLLRNSPTPVSAEDLAAVQPTRERLAAVLDSRLLRTRLAQQYELARRLGLEPNEAEFALSRMSSITPIGTEGFSIQVTCRGYSALRQRIYPTLNRAEARQLCADLANSFLFELEQYVTRTSVEEAGKKRQFIETLMAHVQADLRETERQLASLQQRHELVDPADQVALVNDRLKALEQARAEALTLVGQTESALGSARGQLGRTDYLTIAGLVESRNPVINSLEQKLAELQLQLAEEEAAGKTRQNRDVQQTLAAIQSIEKQLDDLGKKVLKETSNRVNPAYDKLVDEVVSLQVTLAGARARSAKTANLLSAARSRLQTLPPVSRTYATLKQDQEVGYRTLASLKQSLAVALIEQKQGQQAGEFLVLDRAEPPPELREPPILLSGLLVFVLVLTTVGFMSMNRMLFGA